MPARPGGHYCSGCKKTVHHLSDLTPEQAARVVRSASESTCVSYAVVEDGRVVFRNGAKGRLAVTLAAFLSACAAPGAGEEDSAERKEPQTIWEVEASSGQDVQIDAPTPDADAQRFLPVAPPVRLTAPRPEGPRAAWPTAGSPPAHPPRLVPKGASSVDDSAVDDSVDDKVHLPVLAGEVMAAPEPAPPPPFPRGKIRLPEKTAGKPLVPHDVAGGMMLAPR